MLALVGVTLVMVLFTSLEGAFYRVGRGDQVDWQGLIRMRTLDWVTCAAFVPPLYGLILVLIRKRAAFLTTGAWLLLASLLAACGKFVLFAPAAALLEPTRNPAIGAAIHADLLGELMFYWAVIAGLYAFLYYRAQVHDRPVEVMERPGPNPAEGRLLVRQRAGVLVVPFKEIFWVEAQGNYSALHLTGRRRLIRQTMRSLEQDLPPARFVRVHRSAIVNVGHARRLEAAGNAFRVILEDETSVPVSRSCVDALRSRMGSSADFSDDGASPPAELPISTGGTPPLKVGLPVPRPSRAQNGAGICAGGARSESAHGRPRSDLVSTPVIGSAKGLTPRQIECLRWVRMGKSSTDIGSILGLSPTTVDGYIADACRRLEVRTRTQAAVEVVIRGLVDS